MILFASAGFSARDAQPGGNRGGISAHKYAGFNEFSKNALPSPEERLRRRRSRLYHRHKQAGFGERLLGQKQRDGGTIPDNGYVN
jgi:hypothetical protein